MKEQKIMLKVKGITAKQWSNLLLEFNLIKKAWKSYGVNIDITAHGLKNAIKWGTQRYVITRSDRPSSE